MERYSGKVTPVGNSKGIRLDAAFFKAHPEFKGEVRATVLADGQVLLSAKAAPSAKFDESDPVLLGFLRFLETQLAKHPESIIRADKTQLSRIGKLVKGIETE
jgi:antitoxin PrlF